MTRVPLLHFAVLGLALFAVRGLNWPTDGNGVRSESESSGSIDQALLHRAAVTLGLDAEAAVVRQRLVAVGQFLDLAANATDADVEREARALGLADTDPVIRRHIEQLADLALQHGGAAVLPSGEEVEAYYRAHRDRFLDPSRVRLFHVYFSADRRGDAVQAAALTAYARLGSEHLEPADVRTWGDPFMRGSAVESATSTDLSNILGAELAAAVEALPEHGWSGPLRSTYGLHLVWVDSRLPARPRPLAAVRNQIVHLLAHERGQVLARQRLELLRRLPPG